MQTDSLEIKILSLLLVLETFLHIQEKKKKKKEATTTKKQTNQTKTPSPTKKQTFNLAGLDIIAYNI